MMFFLAKTEPGGCEGYEWKTAGEAGAIEVPDYVAYHLVALFPKMYFVVDKAAQKVEAKVEADEEVSVAEVEANEAKAAPKKRTTAPKE